MTDMRLLRVPLPLSPNTDKTGQLVAVCICSPHSLQGAALYNTLQHHLTTRHSLEIHTPVYPGSTLPSARFRLPPRAPSYADPMDHHTTTTCEVEQQRHRDHQRAPEVSGNGDAEGGPPPHTTYKCKRCKYVEASCTFVHGDKLKHKIRAPNLGPIRHAWTCGSLTAHLTKSIRIRTHTYLGLNTERGTP